MGFWNNVGKAGARLALHVKNGAKEVKKGVENLGKEIDKAGKK
jgi:hypothetical protein